MLGAGRRDRTVTFERAVTVQDAYGEDIPTWTVLGRAAAAVTYGAGAERRQAAMERGTQVATFRVLATVMTRSVGYADRVTMDGRAWDIVSIAPVRRTEIEFVARRGETVTPPPPAGEGGAFDFSDPDNSGLMALILEDA